VALGLKAMPSMMHYAKSVTPLSNLDIRLLKGFYVNQEQELMDEEDKTDLKEKGNYKGKKQYQDYNLIFKRA